MAGIAAMMSAIGAPRRTEMTASRPPATLRPTQPNPNPTERSSNPVESTDWIGEQDHYLFNEGTHHHLYEKLGSHVRTINGAPGTQLGDRALHGARVAV